MVAERDALEHAPREPVLEVGQHGRPARALTPAGAGELVDLVAGLAAEQLGQVLGLLRDEVDDEYLRAGIGDAVGAVLDR